MVGLHYYHGAGWSWQAFIHAMRSGSLLLFLHLLRTKYVGRSGCGMWDQYRTVARVVQVSTVL